MAARGAGLAVAGWSAAAWLLTAAGAGAQQTAPAGPPLVIESMAGADLYRFYCASCHGADGKGNGPVAEALKTRPADLTRIAAASGGRFPRERLIAFVSKGDGAGAAHGSAEMPVWGPIFRWLDADSEARTKVRIENLVRHLETLQAQ
jgi:mono/diheme cytochrome c family protein